VNVTDASTIEHEQTEEEHPSVAALARDVSLGSGARQGAAWIGSARLTVQAIQFLVSIVTARLLLPSEFGIAAVAMAIVAFAQLFTDLGLAAAIVHAKKVTDELLTTAFWLNIGAGMGLAVLVAALAYPFSLLYGHGELFKLLLIASLNFAVTRGAVQTALLERTFNYRRLAIVETTAQLAGIVFVPIAAVLGLGASSLVLGPLLGTMLLSGGLWASVPWRPKGRPRRAQVVELWRFSRGLVAFNSVNYWARNLDTLLLGNVVSTGQLGQYNRAFNLMMVPVQQMTWVLARVLFPSLTRLRDDPPRLGRAWIRGLESAATLAMPVAVTFAATAPALVAVLYGPRWTGTAPILELLALAAVPQILVGSTGAVYRAIGLNDLLFKVGSIATALSLIAIVGGLNWGTHGVAVGLLIAACVGLPIVTWPLIKRLSLGRRELTGSLLAITVPAFALGGGEVAVRIVLHHHASPVVELFLQLCAGGGLYVFALLQMESPALDIILTQGSRLMRRVRSAAPTATAAPAAARGAGRARRAGRAERSTPAGRGPQRR
jgi:O-antigen/teichoic acid export membrane protein